MRMLSAVAIAVFVGAGALADAPYQAGFVTIEVPGNPPDPTFPVAVWYPTLEPATPWQAGPFEIVAARGAPAAPGRFPLIVLSHGSTGSEFGHRDWADRLARSGYVVAAIRHIGDSYDDFSGRGSDVQLTRRPWQVSEALDAVLADPRLAPHIDPDRIGMVGFSAGGYTALKAIGGEPDFGLWAVHCADHPDDHELCPADGHTMPRITRPGWPLPPRDLRIKAAAVMAPLGVVFDRAGLTKVTVPVVIFRAADDHHVRNEWNADSVSRNLPATPEVITVPGDHYVFIAPCPPALATELPDACSDAPGVDRTAIHAEIAEELLLFFGRTLGP
jgi:predicted dienelactone hydrolase